MTDALGRLSNLSLPDSLLVNDIKSCFDPRYIQKCSDRQDMRDDGDGHT